MDFRRERLSDAQRWCQLSLSLSLSLAMRVLWLFVSFTFILCLFLLEGVAGLIVYVTRSSLAKRVCWSIASIYRLNIIPLLGKINVVKKREREREREEREEEEKNWRAKIKREERKRHKSTKGKREGNARWKSKKEEGALRAAAKRLYTQHVHCSSRNPYSVPSDSLYWEQKKRGETAKRKSRNTPMSGITYYYFADALRNGQIYRARPSSSTGASSVGGISGSIKRINKDWKKNRKKKKQNR